jgi:Na+/H+-dicarboxylate symporter
LFTLPFILKFFSRVKPFRHFRAVEAALLTAFSTRSSAAALSLTMESVENKSGVSNKISGFTLPFGATINMNGTVLYECVAAIFIAQAYGIDLTLNEQIIIFLSALLVSIGSAGVPMASLLMISIVLSAVDLPLEGIGLILAIDPILDMFRTSVNVWSDSCCAVVVAKSEGETLKIQ